MPHSTWLTFIKMHGVFCLLVTLTIVFSVEVKAGLAVRSNSKPKAATTSTEYISTHVFKEDNGCTGEPFQSFGYAMNQCIRSTSYSSFMYLPGSTESEIQHHSWAASATCSGSPGMSTFTVPSACGPTVKSQTFHVTASPPWSGLKTGLVFE